LLEGETFEGNRPGNKNRQVLIGKLITTIIMEEEERVNDQPGNSPHVLIGDIRNSRQHDSRSEISDFQEKEII